MVELGTPLSVFQCYQNSRLFLTERYGLGYYHNSKLGLTGGRICGNENFQMLIPMRLVMAERLLNV